RIRSLSWPSVGRPRECFDGTELRMSLEVVLIVRQQLVRRNYTMLRIVPATLLLCCVLIGRGQVHREHRDYVPDETTAVRIAEAVLIGQSGQDRVNAMLPLHADGSNKNYWIVAGSRPDSEAPKFGGGLNVWIDKHSGCI